MSIKFQFGNTSFRLYFSRTKQSLRRGYYEATIPWKPPAHSSPIRLLRQNLKHKVRLHLGQQRKIIATQDVQMALARRDMDLLRLRERVEQRQLLLGRADHVLLRHDHQHRRGRHILHDAVRLPHDDIIVALQRGAILVPRRAAALGIDHVIELLLVGTDAHTRRILAFLRQDGEEGGGVAGGLGLAVLHALGEHAREFLGRELEVEQGADGDAAAGALVERGGAERDGGGEGHAPEGDGVRVDHVQGAQEGEGVGVVGRLLHGVDVVAWAAVAEAEAARVVDQGGDVGELVLLRHFGHEHFFDAVELYAVSVSLLAFCLCRGCREGVDGCA